mmetsp:Transcript_16927/g.55157  ORF Transcript_16927/g.55157 Transcript_16927/m.55157 type:complete len:181 (-) Transcript_16927:29-571(-)|eukprot:scaffold15028_cov100-Isochrysis_galbana.AAC.3
MRARAVKQADRGVSARPSIRCVDGRLLQVRRASRADASEPPRRLASCEEGRWASPEATTALPLRSFSLRRLGTFREPNTRRHPAGCCRGLVLRQPRLGVDAWTASRCLHAVHTFSVDRGFQAERSFVPGVFGGHGARSTRIMCRALFTSERDARTSLILMPGTTNAMLQHASRGREAELM